MYVLGNLGIMKLRKQEKLKNERFVKVDRHHKAKKNLILDFLKISKLKTLTRP